MENLTQIISLRKNITESQAESDLKEMRDNSRNEFHYQMMLRKYLEDDTHPLGTEHHDPTEPQNKFKE